MISKRTFLGISLARRSTRRWLVAGFWTFALLLAALAFLMRYFHLPWLQLQWFWLSCGLAVLSGWMFRFLGGTGIDGVVGDFTGRTETHAARFVDLLQWKDKFETSSLDERDKRLRNAAHYDAYRILRQVIRIVVIPVMLLLIMRPTELLFSNKPKLASFMHGIFQIWDAGNLPLFLLFLLLFWTLPQTLILWFEPDVEEAQ